MDAQPGNLPSTADATPINILIVDDEPKNLTVLESLLDAPGYRLVRAESADQALLALVAEEFALLILDVRMPGMTGFELAQIIKGRRKTAQVPIIFLTAYYNEDQHILEGYGSGAVDYLHKPVNAAVLRSKVAIFAELHRKGREVVATNRSLLAEVAERRRVEEQLRELNEQLDRRVAERTEALRGSDARYRTLFHSIDEGFCVLQRVPAGTPGSAVDFIVAECNQAFQKHSGLADVEGQRLSAVLPEFEPHWLSGFESVVSSGQSLRRQGEVKSIGRFVEMYAFRLDALGNDRIAILFRDITERFRSEEALRERERFLRAVTGAARIGLAIIEPGETYRFANEFIAQMLALPVQDIVGRPVAAVMGDAWSPLRPQLQRALAGERVSFEFSMPGAAETGGRHFGAFLEPHADQEGARTVAVVMVEITDLKRLESELRETDRRKDEFLATLAHELRNPLAPVRNAVQILGLKASASKEVVWASKVIDRQVRVMVRLIDDLMDVTRINQGRIDLRLVPIELSAVLALALESSRPQIEEFSHELVVDQPGVPVYVQADLTRLAQVFMNLITNAAKYTDKGGRLEVAVELRDAHVRISVRDNGIGIAAAHLGGVFNMFSQVESALTRSRGGLGIGLSLAKRLVEMHQGRIEARSAGPGLGSEFSVTLPRWSDPAAVSEAPHVAPGAGAHACALRILVVDDNVDGADSLSQLLALGGHEVRTAYDGRAGLDAAAEIRPDVILLDIGMPKLNGYDTCRQLRAEAWGRQITIIATTGWGDPGAKQAVSDAGFDFHFVKPLDEALLMRTLSKVCPGARAD